MQVPSNKQLLISLSDNNKHDTELDKQVKYIINYLFIN